MKRFAKIALLPVFLTSLLAVGCGGGGDTTTAIEPDAGEKQKQARLEAYGKGGIPTTTGTGGNPEASARAKAQGGR